MHQLRLAGSGTTRDDHEPAVSPRTVGERLSQGLKFSCAAEKVHRESPHRFFSPSRIPHRFPLPRRPRGTVRKDLAKTATLSRRRRAEAVRSLADGF
ncbi:hypothetical protein [Streptomyces sp. NRRL S-31]|uniref:hypothetical protein n=1 Tax=Streptomyces sp. NRRL S-31 TaxID=1463898 RepID=UPI0020A65325|nr:hypothetical protein [Streptomyces sp. NRRL S-31]